MPVTAAQRQTIITLVRDGVESHEIAARLGLTVGTVAAVKAHITMGNIPLGDVVQAAEAEVANAVDAAFGLERDLQAALRRSIEQLEPSLKISDGGREKVVTSGRIDITAKDADGALVVIELKAGVADREAVSQILHYMGDLMETNPKVRGILIAREFAPRAVSAARPAPSLRLVEYGFRFTFGTAGGLRK